MATNGGSPTGANVASALASADAAAKSSPAANASVGAVQGCPLVGKINCPNVDPVDKKVLCSAICNCKNSPGIGKDGRLLKQSCVSARLRELDSILQHRSEYKPECNFDMTRKPPTPIMDSDIETKPHPWLPGHIDKHWEEDHNSPYLKGTGMVRRPDVIIVKDPNKPPTHDNIKQVVEIKFPPDKMDRAQEEAYTRIAGDETKLVVMGPDDCDCNQKDPDGSKIPVEQMGTAVTLTGILYMLLTKRPSPVPVY